MFQILLEFIEYILRDARKEMWNNDSDSDSGRCSRKWAALKLSGRHSHRRVGPSGMEAARRDAAEAKTGVGVLQVPIPGVFGAR